ncbi:pyridoxal 5'-phosphate synthase glutaminase subunit PdxT [Chryseomicrobium aureum]|uniref:pyridoxal 5'-phosphate synthase glutaminase subunit PdxT n=1 Tax=Chryseomicrobium aureum TaxID=1441723 RepID=UPI0023BABBBA|nr:pyridoxal 5'-phosphate synthase glutaminase subunit PdxT [Chryseomicrobium aureum]
MRIGVLALQGAVREHVLSIEESGATAVQVKRLEDLEGLDALVLPGGESTTMRKLLDRYELLEPIRKLAEEGIPMFGTCAGLILLARNVVGQESHLGVMDVTVERNSFGRQVDSFEIDLYIVGFGESFPAVFIRAPHIVEVGKSVEVLAKHDGRIVLARDGNFLGCSFHPELTEDHRLMRYFVKLVSETTPGVVS